MSHIWLIILVLMLNYSTPVLSAVVMQRNLGQFGSMIYHKGLTPADYLDYGCWCGWGNSGTLAMDATDICCYIHDQCYTLIDRGLSCSTKLTTYAWKGQPNNVIECTDSIGTCDRNVCECDKAAADCFAKQRSTYNPAFYDMNQNACYS